jgi:hypothetical protein
MVLVSNYSNMKELSQSGVYAFVHHRTKSLYISYSNNILISVSKHISDMKQGIHSNKSLNKYYSNLKLYILEFCSPEDLRIRQSYYYDLYKSQGYKLYNQVPPVKYKTRIVIDPKTKTLVRVDIVNSQNKSSTIGYFDNIHDAESFCKYINSLTPIRPVYATNELTTTLLKK